MADRVHPLYTDSPADPSVAKRQEEQNKNFQKALHEASYKSPTPLPLYHQDYRARRRRCNPCCCCLGLLCSILFVILILLGVAALVLYLVLHPKAPNFSVTDAHISVFNMTDTPMVQSAAAASQYLQTDVNFTVEAGNPNKKIGIYYDDINVDLFYEGTQIGNGSLPSFYLGHKDTQQLQLEMKGQDVPLTEATDSSLKTAVASESSISLQVKTVIRARLKIGSWKSRDLKFKVNCDVEISSPVAGESTQLLSKSCKLKVVNIWS